MRSNNGIAFQEVVETVGIGLVVAVEAVEIHHPKQRRAADRLYGQVLHGGAGCVVKILYVEFEILLLNLISAQRIDVFHHQSPVGKLWRHGSALEQLQVERLARVGDIARKFADLVVFTLVGIFVSHAKNLVGVKSRCERDVAQRGIEFVFARRQQSCALDFLEVATTLNTNGRQRLERRCHRADVASVGIAGFDFVEQAVAVVRRHRHRRIGRPMVALKHTVFAQVHKADDVSRLVVGTARICNPHFNARNVDARRHIRQLRSKFVVVFAEEMRQEEVSVFVVFVGIDAESGLLCAALCVDGLRFAVLLRHKRRYGQFAELQLGFHTEKRRATFDERRPGGHRHVARLDAFDDFIFFAFILKFEVLGVEIEGCIGVVRHVEFQLIAHRRIDSCLNFLVEVEVGFATCACRECRVVGLVRLYAHLHLYATLRLELHPTRSEHLFQRSERELHVENIKLVFALILVEFGILLAIVFHHRLANFFAVVFVSREDKRRNYFALADACSHDVAPGRRVVYRLRLDVRRVAQVDRILFVREHLVVGRRHCIFHLIVQPRRVGGLRRLSR